VLFPVRLHQRSVRARADHADLAAAVRRAPAGHRHRERGPRPDPRPGRLPPGPRWPARSPCRCCGRRRSSRCASRSRCTPTAAPSPDTCTWKGVRGWGRTRRSPAVGCGTGWHPLRPGHRSGLATSAFEPPRRPMSESQDGRVRQAGSNGVSAIGVDSLPADSVRGLTCPPAPRFRHTDAVKAGAE
jgi:hypothetical protein